MITAKLSDINVNDFQTLIVNSVHEGKTIEFKQHYSLNSEKEKGEFLADVSSFVNASGGDLIFGIGESDGSAAALTPFFVENIDDEKLKIEDILRAGISPRITTEMRFIDDGNGRFFLMLRLPKSWFPPHRVVYEGYSKTRDQFYARNSGGKYRLDVMELRNAFAMSETLTEKVKMFHTQRLAAIQADETPVPLSDGGRLILHIVPFASFTSHIRLNMKELIDVLPQRLSPMYKSSFRNKRLNFDGFLTFSDKAEENSHSYTQLYRSGLVEAVDAAILAEEWSAQNGIKYIPSDYYEPLLIEKLKEYLCCLQELDINPPVCIFITLTGVKDFAMGVSDRMRNAGFRFDNPKKIDRDVLRLPEHILEDYGERAEDILRPMFDILWNACGYDQSPYFDQNGQWVLK